MVWKVIDPGRWAWVDECGVGRMKVVGRCYGNGVGIAKVYATNGDGNLLPEPPPGAYGSSWMSTKAPPLPPDHDFGAPDPVVAELGIIRRSLTSDRQRAVFDALRQHGLRESARLLGYSVAYVSKILNEIAAVNTVSRVCVKGRHGAK